MRRATPAEAIAGGALFVALGSFYAWHDRGSTIERLQRATDAASPPRPKSLATTEASVDSLQFKLALSNETDFERAHGLHPRFSDCQAPTGNAMSCSTFTDEGAPVAYHCDYVGCVIDCGVAK